MTTTVPKPSAPNALQMLHWIFDPIGYQQQNFRQCGDVMDISGALAGGWMQGSTTPGNRVLMVSHPEGLQQILTQDTGSVFAAPGEVNSIFKPLLGEYSVILLSGSAHRRRRQMITPPFHGERLKAYGDLIVEIATRTLGAVAVGDVVNAREHMQHMTMQVILQAVFGLYAGDRYDRLAKLLADRLNMTSDPVSSMVIFFPWMQRDWGAWSPGAKIQAMEAATNALIFQEIHERREQGFRDRRDVLSLLMMAEDESGQGLTDQELRDELMTLLIAGHETTATALTWACYWIHRLPTVRQKLLEELATLGDNWDPMAMMGLPYLEAVCQETLRIHPVAMLTFPRRVEQPVSVLGYDLVPGDLIMGSITLIHQREDLYPQPQEFRPERFLERQFSPYEFVSFGGGVRRCVGAALAMYEMKLILGTWLRQSSFTLESTTTLKPQRRGLTVSPSGDVLLRKGETALADRPTATLSAASAHS